MFINEGDNFYINKFVIMLFLNFRLLLKYPEKVDLDLEAEIEAFLEEDDDLTQPLWKERSQRSLFTTHENKV